MKKIDLAQPFESVSRAISSLPLTGDGISQPADQILKEATVTELLRDIYEGANGRQVATTIGLVAIAPPVAPQLKEEPFFVETQADFLSQAMWRIADGAGKRPAGVAANAPLGSSRCGVYNPKNTPEYASDWRKGSCMRVP